MAYLLRAFDSGTADYVTWESVPYPLDTAPIAATTTPNYTGSLSSVAILSTTTGVFEDAYVNGYITRSTGGGTTGTVRNGDAAGGVNLTGSNLVFRVGLGTGYTASTPVFTWTLQNLDVGLIGTSTQASTYTGLRLETAGTNDALLTVSNRARVATSLSVSATVDTTIAGLFRSQGTSSATWALVAEDSAGADLFVVRSDGRVAVTSSARLGVGTLTPSEIFHVYSSGDVLVAKAGPLVGIGTASPTSRLHIVGGTPPAEFPDAILRVTGDLADAVSFGCNMAFNAPTGAAATVLFEGMRITLSDNSYSGSAGTYALTAYSGVGGTGIDHAFLASASGSGNVSIGASLLASGGTIRVGCYAALASGSASVAASAGLVADNGSVSAAIALFLDNGTEVLRVADAGHLTFAAGVNIIAATSTGTKIGTATTQLLGFWNATPVDQPAHINDPSGGVVIDAEARTALNSVLDLLQETGLMAA